MELLDYEIVYLLFDLRNKSMVDGVRRQQEGRKVGRDSQFDGCF